MLKNDGMATGVGAYCRGDVAETLTRDAVALNRDLYQELPLKAGQAMRGDRHVHCANEPYDYDVLHLWTVSW